ncbi:ABC-F family ATP-binding cassette domain-containing protein OS=Streptomyces tendae OX=1932 GN=GUR47_29365 PE=4 SV=1 [Streptomyces tendae]
MHGLGLARITRDRLLGSLSGGEQSRLALAGVLAAAPSCCSWTSLRTTSTGRPCAGWRSTCAHTAGTVVAVTHDRDFLERLARIIA